MVLIEQGPWSGDAEQHLRRIQTRIYDCIDAAVDGQLAEQFPESRGKDVVIQLDCYNVPRSVVEEFFNRFTVGVFAEGAYREALEKSDFVASISFAVQFDQVH